MTSRPNRLHDYRGRGGEEFPLDTVGVPRRVLFFETSLYHWKFLQKVCVYLTYKGPDTGTHPVCSLLNVCPFLEFLASCPVRGVSGRNIKYTCPAGQQLE